MFLTRLTANTDMVVVNFLNIMAPSYNMKFLPIKKNIKITLIILDANF
jgi:hypothetical protein